MKRTNLTKNRVFCENFFLLLKTPLPSRKNDIGAAADKTIEPLNYFPKFDILCSINKPFANKRLQAMDTVTSVSLLEAIKDGHDDRAWSRFILRYRPMIVAFARRLELNIFDAEDIGQETLLTFLENYRTGRYRYEQGKFRKWLFTIAWRKVVDLLRTRNQENVVQEEPGTENFWTRVPAPDKLEQIWEEEWQRAVYRACMDEVAGQVPASTMAAFEMFVVQGMTGEEVARQLNMAVSSVYVAKNRVLTQIRKIKKTMEEIW